MVYGLKETNLRKLNSLNSTNQPEKWQVTDGGDGIVLVGYAAK
jgi:hypothetical protein